MKIYTKNEIIQECKETVKKNLYEGKDIPYYSLNDREFEILIYHLFNRHKVELKKEYEYINLMSGVAEQGRDSVLYRDGNPAAIVQCKHTAVLSRMNKSDAAKEIIKFALYTIKNNTIIPKNGQIIYYFVHSHGFKEDAQNFLDNFNEQILLEKDNLKKWTESVIKEYKKLKDFKYEDVISQILVIFSRIKVEKYEKTDIDLLISSQNDILSLFFNIKKVIEMKPELPRVYEKDKPTKEEAISLNSETFIKKLEDIKLEREGRIEAICNYWRAIQTLNMLSDIQYFDEEILFAYQSDLLFYYKHLYKNSCENIEKKVEDENINSLSRQFFRKIMSEKPLEIIDITNNRPFFQSGIYHDMANTDMLPTWKLIKYKEDDNNDIDFDNYF